MVLVSFFIFSDNVCHFCNILSWDFSIRALASARGSVVTKEKKKKKKKKKEHGHSRAREWPKHASPRARRARGRAKVSARLGACQCHYMFFTTQLKIAKFMGRSHDLNVGQKS